MVQTYQSPVRVYKHPFEIVMAAYEKRFPTCKMIPVFLGSDITFEKKSDDNAVHIVERRCRLNVDAPYILKKIVGVDHVIFIQKNTLDRKSRTLKIEAHNESFSSRVIVKENCLYSVHPDNSQWTCFEQSASLDIKSFFGFESMVEKIAMKQYTHNIKKGREVIQYYINELHEEGVKSIPPWRDPSPKNAAAIEDAPSQDSGLISRSNSVSSHHSIESLILGATAASMQGHAKTSEESEPHEVGGKLDDDYIHRFLGQLSLVQESRLIQLRAMLHETHKEKLMILHWNKLIKLVPMKDLDLWLERKYQNLNTCIMLADLVNLLGKRLTDSKDQSYQSQVLQIPKDTHILRFLQARDFNLEKSREMLVHSLAWRKMHNIDRLLQSYEITSVLQNYYSGGWHYSDKEGRPLYILRLGNMDVKGLIKSVGEDDLLKHVLYVNEQGINKTAEATKLSGKPVRNCTCILDLDGLSMRHLWRPGIRALLRIIEIVEANYPETMGRMLIVRAPRVFPVLWTLVSPFIDENTRKKFIIFGGNDYQAHGGLAEFVDAQYVPDFLGGQCSCTVPEGGLVPKSLYMKDDDCDKSPDTPPLSTSSLYHTTHVVKEYPHEVLIQIPKKGSVITWDFDILKGDVTFTVFYCRRQLHDQPSHFHHVSGATGGKGSVQYIEKSMVVGVDLSIVEAPSICRDGDSLQGSHVTSQPGSYVLQWKFFDTSKASFDFPLTTHKSKVMYYTEVLESEKFRGSMSSLQSNYSSLSISTTQSGQSGNSSCPSR